MATPDRIPGMDIALSIIGVAFAAFCVWLGIRFYNRRERWAKWTLAALAVLVLLVYPLSIGPALILTQKYPTAKFIMAVYRPFVAAMCRSSTAQSAVMPYVQWWVNGASFSYDPTGRIELLDGPPEDAWPLPSVQNSSSPRIGWGHLPKNHTTP